MQVADLYLSIPPNRHSTKTPLLPDAQALPNLDRPCETRLHRGHGERERLRMQTVVVLLLAGSRPAQTVPQQTSSAANALDHSLPARSRLKLRLRLRLRTQNMCPGLHNPPNVALAVMLQHSPLRIGYRPQSLARLPAHARGPLPVLPPTVSAGTSTPTLRPLSESPPHRLYPTSIPLR
jgi:hypothetical protein